MTYFDHRCPSQLLDYLLFIIFCATYSFHLCNPISPGSPSQALSLSEVRGSCCDPRVPPPRRVHMVNLCTEVMAWDAGGHSFGRWWSHESSALVNEGDVLIKEAPESYLALLPHKNTQMTLSMRNGPSHQICWSFVFVLSVSRMMNNNLPIFMHYSFHCILL